MERPIPDAGDGLAIYGGRDDKRTDVFSVSGDGDSIIRICHVGEVAGPYRRRGRQQENHGQPPRPVD
jgi:hypothetical protein